VMTHPDHRGQGYLHTLGERCFADMRACGAIGYTFPNHLSEKSFRRTGWTELGRVPSRAMPIHSRDEIGNASLEEITEAFDARATQIWNEAPFRVAIHRDQDYLNWRYQKPGSTYHRFISTDNHSILVLKLYESAEIRNVHICDLFVSQGKKEEQVQNLLAFANSFGHKNGATRLTAWLHDSHDYAESFHRSGLVLDDDAPERYIFVDAPQAVHPDVSKESNWYLSHTDNDIF